MEEIEVGTINGTKKETVLFVDEFVNCNYMYDIIETKKRNMYTRYITVFGTFDIECTTIEPPIEKFHKGKPVYKYSPFGFMYQWQFCINETVVFGRTWNEFLLLLKCIHDYFKLDECTKFVIYVHSLAYEFQFMKDFLQIDSVFARKKRKPLKVSTLDGFEFRCSYFLSNMSLAKLCENYGAIHYKKIDTYDYRKIRLPSTPLTSIEKDYCYCDVRGLHESVTNLIDWTGYNIATVPMTSTGFVRNEVRKNVLSNKANQKVLKRCEFNMHIYEILNRMFRGGDTHANRFFSAYLFDETVYTVDRASSYPHVQMTQKFPMGQWQNATRKVTDNFKYFDAYVYKKDPDGELDEMYDKSCIIHIAFKNIRLKEDQPTPYIDAAHILHYIKDGKDYEKYMDNGRLIYINDGWIELYLTDIDYQIIDREYDWDSIKLFKFYICRRDYLPLEYRQSILEYFEGKCKLKDVEGKEYEYMKSKNSLNGIFGMACLDILADRILFENNLWDIDDNFDKEAELKKVWKSYNLFQSYAWGIWVTAYARFALHEMIWILKITNHIYNDTDSCKFLEYDKFKDKIEQLNKEIIEKNESMDLVPKCEINGRIFYMGVWEMEKNYEKFITFGAKKYAYNQEGEFYITVSGMNKEKGAKSIGCIENFQIGKTYHDVGRTTSWFNDDCIHYIEVEGEKILTASNIGVLDTTYSLGITDEYLNVIETTQNCNLKNRMKGDSAGWN